ncbi:MAG: aminotransferase class I/II-fold pyridoxal phosphate-dependent enzyme, partial [Rhodospirillaceae bacterium]
LPDYATMECLAAAAAGAYGLPDAGMVAPASGSQALIQLLPRLRPPGLVAVAGPTYAEHAACWQAAGHRMVFDHSPFPDVAIFINPNNPDGRRTDPSKLIDLAREQGSRGGWLVVDEAFADVAPEISVAANADTPGLIVLRSFGKFFGLAGLRLGFALAEPVLAARIRAALGPWAVSGPAAAIATVALADKTWIAATRIRLELAAARLDLLLETHGLSVLGGTSLFRLVETAEAQAIEHRLAAAGILIRGFTDYPRWLRFGLPPDEAAWQRLEIALSNNMALVNRAPV